jgi:hypothetical protein
MTLFKSCGSSADSFDIKSIIISPDPPVVGKPLTIRVIGTIHKAITAEATVRLEAYVGIFTVKEEEFPLCQTLKLPCPIAPRSDADLTMTVVVPDEVPAGVMVKVRLTAKNGDGSPLFCLTGDWKFNR